MEHWGWIPLLLFVVSLCVWLSGCTLSTGSQSQLTAVPSAQPRVTLTLRPQIMDTAIPSPKSSVRVAVQPTVPPSPTPNLYTVKENDTLLDIALQFNVELSDLQAANPIVDPRALQIGQELVIPSDNPASPIVQGPPPPALPLTPPTCHASPTGSVQCFGLIENNQDQPVHQLSVLVEAINGEGTIIEKQVATVEQTYVLPGKLAPYRVLFNDLAIDEVRGTVAALNTGATSDTITNDFVPLQTENVTTQISGGRYLVAATLTNRTEKIAAPPRIVVTLLLDNQIRGYRVWDADASLAPTTSLDVRLPVLPVNADDLTNNNLTYTLHVEARAAQ